MNLFNDEKKDLNENPYSPPLQEDQLRDAMEYRDYFEDDAEFQEALAIWPICPECGRRRITRCPICKTIGNLFPLADADYWVQSSDQVLQNESHSSCSCRHCDSSETASQHLSSNGSAPLPKLPPLDVLGQYIPNIPTTNPKNPNDAQSNKSSESEEQNRIEPFPNTLDGQLMPGVRDWRKNDYSIVEVSPEHEIISVENKEYHKEESVELPNRNALESQEGQLKLVTCYVCSESFEPKFPAQCEWCNHQFEKDNGTESESQSLETSSNLIDEWHHLHELQALQQEDELNPKIIFVLAALGILFLIAILYSLIIFTT